MVELCQARVWDNGDMTDCGMPAVRAKRCSRCIASEVKGLTAKIATAEAELQRLRVRWAEIAPIPGHHPSCSPGFCEDSYHGGTIACVVCVDECEQSAAAQRERNRKALEAEERAETVMRSQAASLSIGDVSVWNSMRDAVASALRDAKREAFEEAAGVCGRFAAREMSAQECEAVVRAMAAKEAGR